MAIPKLVHGVVLYMTQEEETTFLTQIAAMMAALATPAVPTSVTRRQGLQQLRIEGYAEAQIEALIPTLPISDLAKDLALIEFKTSQVFERNRPLVATLGAMLGKDSAWLDTMFINAAKLP